MFFLQSAALMAAVTLISFIPLRHLIDLFLGNNYFFSHLWTKGLGLLIAGTLVWAIGRQYNIETYCPVDAAGRFYHASGASGTLPEELIGKTVWEANPVVIEILVGASVVLGSLVFLGVEWRRRRA